MKKIEIDREQLRIRIEAVVAAIAFAAIVALVTYPVAEVTGHLTA